MTNSERKAYMREYRAKHKEDLKLYYHKWWKRYGESVCARRRIRYYMDEEFRNRELKRHAKKRRKEIA